MTLRDATADLFATILAFRAATNEERAPYRIFRQEVSDRIAEFDRRCERENRDPNGEARFALVALIDETVMNSDWDDAAEWSRNPLQMQYYGDFTAGDRFFERLEKLQAGANDELLEVYFTVLCAGFRGRYRDDPHALMTIRSRLFQRLPVPNLRDETHLTPEAYGRTLERPRLTRRIPIAWLVPVLVAVIVLYGAYYLILERQVAEIGDMAAKPLVVTSQPK
jgi:type VI secretion system protein ImpK